MLKIAALVFGTILASGTAGAIELQQRGAVLVLSGPIRDGDQYLLRDHLAGSGAQTKIVSLNSPGGKIIPAREMARAIRSAGLTTLVDAAKARCESACTGLFVAGVRRHYLNAGAIVDGGARRAGLGFHEGNAVGASGKDYSGRATSGMTNIYYEMGVSGAASLVTKATFNKMYSVSGETALSLGIATSLGAP